MHFLQSARESILSPGPPPPKAHLGPPKVAIIGAGFSGVLTAAHCVGHGFDATIFEAGSRRALGGIWSKEKTDNSSNLQLDSMLYRFRPSTKGPQAFSDRSVVLRQITQLWGQYGLENRTKFDTDVSKVYKADSGKWVVNDTSNGLFDGIIVAVGTCGHPALPRVLGQARFQGEIVHTSRLGGRQAKDKNIVIIAGGGTGSIVEALEFAATENAAKAYILTSSNDRIIPHVPVIDELFFKGLGKVVPPGRVFEAFLGFLCYPFALLLEHRGANKDIPVRVLDFIRSGKVEWLHGKILRFSDNGIRFNLSRPGGAGTNERHVEADFCIMATGYEYPSLRFLPENVLPQPFKPPHWFLQAFPPAEMEICAINCLTNTRGSSGTCHAAACTRFLLMILIDPASRPPEKWAERYIDSTTWAGWNLPNYVSDVCAYWGFLSSIVLVMLASPSRWKWAPFVLFGSSATLPKTVVREEEMVKTLARRTEKMIDVTKWIKSQTPSSITAFFLYTDLLFIFTVGLFVRIFRWR